MDRTRRNQFDFRMHPLVRESRMSRRPLDGLNYNHLFYFHVAATEGSIARAAERLGVTQPTVSEQIQQLERALAITLFERVKSGIRMTDAGRHAFGHTSVMFREGERLVEGLGRTTSNDHATLRVGMSFATARIEAPDFLFALLSLDGCVPSVHHADLSDLLQGLRARDLDLVIAETAPVGAARQKLQVDELSRVRLVAVARPGVTPDPTWSDAGYVQYTRHSVFRGEVQSYLEGRGLRPTSIATTDDPLMMLEAATRIDCIAFVPEAIARHACAAGVVRVIATLDPGPVTTYTIHHATGASDLVFRAIAALQVEDSRASARTDGKKK
jgi:LysR family transcriptional activator of nhaA